MLIYLVICTIVNHTPSIHMISLYFSLTILHGMVTDKCKYIIIWMEGVIYIYLFNRVSFLQLLYFFLWASTDWSNQTWAWYLVQPDHSQPSSKQQNPTYVWSRYQCSNTWPRSYATSGELSKTYVLWSLIPQVPTQDVIMVAAQYMKQRCCEGKFFAVPVAAM